MKILMGHFKDTKGTHVYKEIGLDGFEIDNALAKIPQLYIRKSAFNGEGAPERIHVEVTE